LTRAWYLLGLCFIALFLNTDASAEYEDAIEVVSVQEQDPKRDIFSKFHPVAKYKDAAFNPGCDSKKAFPQMIRISGLSNAWQIVHDCKKYDPTKVSSGIKLFYTAWKANFGDPEGKIWKTLNEILIEWSPEKKTVAAAYSIDGKFLKNPSVIGLALSPGWIWVHASKEPMYKTMANTSFVHELVHISLWSMKPHYKPDLDHEGTAYAGWTKKHSSLVIDVNWKLMNRGL